MTNKTPCRIFRISFFKKNRSTSIIADQIKRRTLTATPAIFQKHTEHKKRLTRYTVRNSDGLYKSVEKKLFKDFINTQLSPALDMRELQKQVSLKTCNIRDD